MRSSPISKPAGSDERALRRGDCGGGVGGLVAAALLARAAWTVVLERAPALFTMPSNSCARSIPGRQTVEAVRRGLKFAVRDLTLTVLRAGGQAVVMAATVTARSLACCRRRCRVQRLSPRTLRFARALRFTWWDGRPGAETPCWVRPNAACWSCLSVASASSFRHLVRIRRSRRRSPSMASLCGFAVRMGPAGAGL